MSETPETPKNPDAVTPLDSESTQSAPAQPEQSSVPQPPQPIAPAAFAAPAAPAPQAPAAHQPPPPYQAPTGHQPPPPYQAPQPQYQSAAQHQPTSQHQPTAQYPTEPLRPGQPAGAPTGSGFAGQPPVTPPVAGSTNNSQGSSFRRKSTVGLVAALAVAALVGGVSGAGVVLLTNSNNSGSNSPTTANFDPTSLTINDPADASTITAVAAKAAPSVVTISVSAGESGGTGSGVVLSADGYVLTNTHVVTLDGASSDGTISVQLNDGRLFPATIVGTDPISDLAVIKLTGATDLQPATFADSSKLNVGETAIAIGAPLGLNGTVTDGIVSALNRSITVASSAVPENTEEESQDSGEAPFDLWGFDLPGQDSTTTTSTSTISLAVVQTDAAINPGNSGGALLNAQGEVIGINVAIASAGSSDASSTAGSIGVGFAIPANLAERVSSEIIANGSATHGLLGASVGDVTTEESDTVGAVIKEVISGGAAESAGLKVGDIVTSFNGLPITGMTDLTAQVRALAAGATAEVTYVRDGQSASADVTLGALE